MTSNARDTFSALRKESLDAFAHTHCANTSVAPVRTGNRVLFVSAWTTGVHLGLRVVRMRTRLTQPRAADDALGRRKVQIRNHSSIINLKFGTRGGKHARTAPSDQSLILCTYCNRFTGRSDRRVLFWIKVPIEQFCFSFVSAIGEGRCNMHGSSSS